MRGLLLSLTCIVIGGIMSLWFIAAAYSNQLSNFLLNSLHPSSGAIEILIGIFTLAAFGVSWWLLIISLRDINFRAPRDYIVSTLIPSVLAVIALYLPSLLVSGLEWKMQILLVLAPVAVGILGIITGVELVVGAIRTARTKAIM